MRQIAPLAADEVFDWREYLPLRLPPILAAALTEFDRLGYDGTSVRTIAGRVGVTVPALYYHFENKQAMLIALVVYANDTLHTRAGMALAEAAGDPVLQSQNLVECVALYMAHRSELAFLVTEVRNLGPRDHAVYLARRRELEHMLFAAIEDGNRQGRFCTPYPHEASRATLSACQGIAGWYRGEGPEDCTELARRYVDLFLATVNYTA